MTTAAGRRLTKLEGALHPREAVLAWLVEAQQFPSVRRSVGDAAFLFCLVLQVNTRALDIAKVEGLRAQAPSSGWAAF